MDISLCTSVIVGPWSIYSCKTSNHDDSLVIKDCRYDSPSTIFAYTTCANKPVRWWWTAVLLLYSHVSMWRPLHLLFNQKNGTLIFLTCRDTSVVTQWGVICWDSGPPLPLWPLSSPPPPWPPPPSWPPLPLQPLSLPPPPSPPVMAQLLQAGFWLVHDQWRQDFMKAVTFNAN